MNRAIGLAGLVVVLSACFLGIGVILSGLRQQRPRLMRMARPYAFIVLLGAVAAPCSRCSVG